MEFILIGLLLKCMWVRHSSRFSTKSSLPVSLASNSRTANLTLQRIEDTERESGSINFYMGYTGPLGGTNKQVKIDIVDSCAFNKKDSMTR